MRGISERKGFVDSERPQSLQQMEPILETLNDGVVIADASEHILFVNAVFEEMTGIPRGQIVGRDARYLYDRAEDFALAHALFQKALKIASSGEFMGNSSAQR